MRGSHQTHLRTATYFHKTVYRKSVLWGSSFFCLFFFLPPWVQVSKHKKSALGTHTWLAQRCGTHRSGQPSTCHHVAFKQLGGIALVVTADQTIGVVHAGTVDCKPAESFPEATESTARFTRSAVQHKTPAMQPIILSPSLPLFIRLIHLQFSSWDNQTRLSHLCLYIYSPPEYP